MWETAAEVDIDPGAPISAAVASAGGRDSDFGATAWQILAGKHGWHTVRQRQSVLDMIFIYQTQYTNTIAVFLPHQKYWYRCSDLLPSILSTSTFDKNQWYREPTHHY